VIDEVAIQRELADERIDLPQGQRDGRPPLDIFTDEAIREGADVERRLRRIIDDGDAMFPGQREDTEDLPDAMGAVVGVEMTAEGADRRPGGGGPAQQCQRRRRRPRRLIADLDAVSAAPGSQVLAE